MARVTKRGVADADASLASLTGEKQDDNLDLFRAELADKAC